MGAGRGESFKILVMEHVDQLDAARNSPCFEAINTWRKNNPRAGGQQF